MNDKENEVNQITIEFDNGERETVTAGFIMSMDKSETGATQGCTFYILAPCKEDVPEMMYILEQFVDNVLSQIEAGK